MKLIYIANARIPTEKAHGIQIAQMCEAFSNNGVEVELLVPRRINPIKENPFDYYEVRKNFKIRKLPCLDLIVLDKYIGRLGLWVENTSFLLSVLFYLFFQKSGIIYIRDKLLLPIAVFKKNVFFEVHGFPKRFFLYSFFIKRTKGLIVITEKLKDLFLGAGLIENRIFIEPDGVDLKKFDIEDKKQTYRKEFNFPEDKKIIGYVGRLETLGKEKGADVLIKALKIIEKDESDVLLCFVGGPLDRIRQYQDFAEKIGLEQENIIFVDQVKHKLIPRYLKSFDVLAMPFPNTEHYAHYMSPLKMFEYMASKRPIAASDLPSIREILNEQNSVLVKPNNAQELAQGIKRLLQDNSFAERLSDKAFQDVEQNTWQKRAKNILKFIKND